jgi:hypothetical protein
MCDCYITSFYSIIDNNWIYMAMAIMLSKHEFITPFIDKVKNNLKIYFKKIII